MSEGLINPEERRLQEREGVAVRLADFTVPELRRSLITALLLLGILGLFIYMIREVLAAALVAIVTAVYLLPFHRWLAARLGGAARAALVTIFLVTVPLVALLVYSWIEISSAAAYLQENASSVASQLSDAIRRLPFAQGVELRPSIERWVAVAGNQTSSIVQGMQSTIDIAVISVAVFLFTVFYILTRDIAIAGYIREKIPGRYRDLSSSIQENVQSVAYGALYATFLTQIVKSAIILGLNLTFGVPLPVVLAIASFFIGFFPVVGSWSVYLPISIYLLVFQHDVFGAVAMLVIGFFVNTIFISLYLRPKIAADKSRVLDFYWMFLALVTGVYTFGIVGILIGPMLLGVLKAIFDTVTGPRPSLQLSESEGGRD